MTETISSTRYLLIAFVITALLCLNSNPLQARLVDRVVAIVNSEVITQTELDEAGKNTFSQIRQRTPAPKLEEALDSARHKILDTLIDNMLVSQKAKELRISVSEQEINGAIERISEENGITSSDLYKQLAKSGISQEQYHRKLSDQILHSKLVNYEVRSKIVISEEKARKYYDTVYSKQQTAEGYHLLQIGITIENPGSSPDNKDKAQRRAEGLRKLALDGQSFEQLAKSFSQLPSSKDGGNLGFFSGDELSGNMKEIIINLDPGQISKVIKTNNSFQFYKLVAKNIDGMPEFAPFEDVREEITNILGKEELDARYIKLLNEIKEQAIIKKLI